MTRAVLVGLTLLALCGCTLPPERAVLTPLPRDGAPRPYAELLTRARLQAKIATEAFYVDHWADLEDAARGLEQTATYLAKADDVPPKQKATLAATSKALGKEAATLREAAAAKNDKTAGQALQRINLAVRELRLDKSE